MVFVLILLIENRPLSLNASILVVFINSFVFIVDDALVLKD